jgi:hypothetical protein
MSNQTDKRISDIEIIQPEYIDEKYLDIFQGGIRVKRHTRCGFRAYTKKDGTSYMSATTFISKTDTKENSKYLDKWRDAKTEEFKSIGKVDEFVEMTANYGTWLHIASGDFCRKNKVIWNEFDFDTYDWLLSKGFNGDVLLKAQSELTKDFASIIQFFHDYKVTVLAIEIPVFWKKVGTCIDFVVSMNVIPHKEMGECERDRAIINLKSGKKGSFDTHILQLLIELKAFNETYKMPFGGQIKRVYNLAPKDWKGSTPTYSLYNHTDKMNDLERILRNRYERLEIDGVFDEMDTHVISNFVGETYFGQSAENNLVKTNIVDFFKEK